MARVGEYKQKSDYKKSTVLKGIKRFKAVDNPSEAFLLECLGIKSLTTFKKYMACDDELGDIFKSAYIHLVKKHEEALWGNKPVAHIFWLKHIKSLGFNFREYDEIPKDTDERKNIIFTIYDGKDNYINQASGCLPKD